MDIDRLLKLMVEKGASDLFITTGVPPSIKIHGRVVPVTTTKLSPEKTRETVMSVMTDTQRKDFVRDGSLSEEPSGHFASWRKLEGTSPRDGSLWALRLVTEA